MEWKNVSTLVARQKNIDKKGWLLDHYSNSQIKENNKGAADRFVQIHITLSVTKMNVIVAIALWITKEDQFMCSLGAKSMKL